MENKTAFFRQGFKARCRIVQGVFLRAIGLLDFYTVVGDSDMLLR